MKKSNIIAIIILIIGCEDSRNFPIADSIDNFNETDLISTMEENVNWDKNLIYCPTLLYAWDELRNKLNGNILIDSKFEELNILNNSKSYLNSIENDEINISAIIQENSILVKSDFSKNLPFQYDFERNNYNLKFGKNYVESFGVNGFKRDVTSQIKILFYKNDSEFAIQLIPRNYEDEIILYRTNKLKGFSLEKHYDQLIKSVNESLKLQRKNAELWRYSIKKDDIVSIPVLEFNLEKHYKSFSNNSFKSDDKEYKIEGIYQRIGFIIDEKGAKVESEAEIEVRADLREDPPTPKQLIFNNSFLIVIKKKKSKNPYMVAWIKNTELMKKKTTDNKVQNG